MADFPGQKRHYISADVSWVYYKHWAQNVWAGEGLTHAPGRGDRSGALDDAGRCGPPKVVLARRYTHTKTKKSISAVWSYPHGLGFEPDYFWEIYPDGDDISRWTTEEEMEKRVLGILEEHKND